MDSARDDARLGAPGCPIRKSPDQSLFGGSPKLFAAYHVLHRWLAPRHSPCALSSLTIQRVSHTQDCTLTEDTYYSVVKDQSGTLLPLTVKQGPKLFVETGASLTTRRRDPAIAPRQKILVERTGIEPATPGLQSRCSPN